MNCAALCFLERHFAVAHSMAGADRANPSLTRGECHPTGTGSVQPSPLPVISPMERAEAITIALAPVVSADPVWTLPTPSHIFAHSVEPPPPRLA